MSELGIAQAYRHDTGVLTCQASNAYGQDEMTIQLIVQGITSLNTFIYLFTLNSNTPFT